MLLGEGDARYELHAADAPPPGLCVCVSLQHDVALAIMSHVHAAPSWMDEGNPKNSASFHDGVVFFSKTRSGATGKAPLRVLFISLIKVFIVTTALLACLRWLNETINDQPHCEISGR